MNSVEVVAILHCMVNFLRMFFKIPKSETRHPQELNVTTLVTFVERQHTTKTPWGLHDSSTFNVNRKSKIMQGLRT